MSYILEALKRSEQLRGQGANRLRLSLQPAFVDEPAADGLGRWRPLVAGARPYLLGGLLLANALILYAALRPGALPAMPAAAQAGAIAAAAPAPPIPPGPAAAPAVRRVAAAIPAAAPKERPSDERREPRRKPAASAAPPAAVAAAKAPPSRAASLPPPPPLPAEVVAPAPRVPAESGKAAGQLPTALQQELPAIRVAGYIDANGVAMAMINDKLLSEGEELASGITVERIEGDSVVFAYKGYRFRR